MNRFNKWFFGWVIRRSTTPDFARRVRMDRILETNKKATAFAAEVVELLVSEGMLTFYKCCCGKKLYTARLYKSMFFVPDARLHYTKLSQIMADYGFEIGNYRNDLYFCSVCKDKIEHVRDKQEYETWDEAFDMPWPELGGSAK